MKKNARSSIYRPQELPEQNLGNSLAEQNPATTPQETSPFSPLQLVHIDQADPFQASDRALQVCYDLPILWDSSDGYDAFSSPDMESYPVNLFDTGNIFPPFGDGSCTPNGALILPPPHPDHVPAWKRRLLLHCEAPVRIIRNMSGWKG